MRGRGAAVRGADARSVRRRGVGWPPETTAGSRGSRPQDRSHGSVVRSGAWTSAIARLRRRVVVAVDRTRGREWRMLWRGENPGEQRPGRPCNPSGASSRGRGVGRVNGLPGGAKLRGGRNGRVPASPEVPGRPSGLPRGATRAVCGRSRRSRGSHVPASMVSLACPFTGAACGARTRRAVETDRTARCLRAGVTVDVEPAGKQKAVERRHGSSGGESSGGRIPGTSRHETRPRGSRA